MCNTEPCPQHCVVGSWSAWSECDKPCGGGVQVQTRPILVPQEYGGLACPATVIRTSCNTNICPQDCEVSEWDSWGQCSVSCGPGGQHLRVRTVHTSAAYGGAACGALKEVKACNAHPCPVNCQVSDWSGWDTCSDSCGGGMHSHSRKITTEQAQALTASVDGNGDGLIDFDEFVIMMQVGTLYLTLPHLTLPYFLP